MMIQTRVWLTGLMVACFLGLDSCQFLDFQKQYLVVHMLVHSLGRLPVPLACSPCSAMQGLNRQHQSVHFLKCWGTYLARHSAAVSGVQEYCVTRLLFFHVSAMVSKVTFHTLTPDLAKCLTGHHYMPSFLYYSYNRKLPS